MKSNLLFFLLIIFLTILQATFLPIIFPTSSTPNLLLMLIISSTLFFDFSVVLKWAIISGMIFDLLAYEKIGFSAIVFVFVAYLVSFFTRRFSIESRLGSFLIIIFLVIVTTFFYRFSIIIFDYYPINILIILKNINFFRNVFLEIIFNSILFVPVFFLVKKSKINNANSMYDLAKLKR